ncbi:MAG: hypothetical protein AAFW89_13075 [Bacteroidota bacterium]
MKKTTVTPLFFLLIPLWVSAQNPDTVQVKIQSESVLLLHGKTNINQFSCRLNQSFENEVFPIALTRSDSILTLENARLDLETASFNCGRRKITKDFISTLKANDHPHIKLEFGRAWFIYEETPKGLIPMLKAIIEITIGTIKKQYTVPVSELDLEGEVLSFSGEQVVSMNDYELVPPSPMMGLIKVRDEISVQFTLFIKMMN